MPKKKTLIILVCVAAACILFAGGYVLMNLSAMRQPTQQEIETHAAFFVDWQASTGMEGTDQEIILSLCVADGERTSGENVYQLYTSDTVSDYLHEFGAWTQIGMLDDILYLQYTTPQGNTVSLGYCADGTTELCVYDAAADTLYFQHGEAYEFWSRFRTGFHFGA